MKACERFCTIHRRNIHKPTGLDNTMYYAANSQVCRVIGRGFDATTTTILRDSPISGAVQKGLLSGTRGQQNVPDNFFRQIVGSPLNPSRTCVTCLFKVCAKRNFAYIAIEYVRPRREAAHIDATVELWSSAARDGGVFVGREPCRTQRMPSGAELLRRVSAERPYGATVRCCKGGAAKEVLQRTL